MFLVYLIFLLNLKKSNWLLRPLSTPSFNTKKAEIKIYHYHDWAKSATTDQKRISKPQFYFFNWNV
jgi:hypothetical protein